MSTFIAIVAIGLFFLSTSFSALAVGMVDEGAQLFEVHCVGCHPKGGNIIRRGKNLKLKTLQRNHLDTPEEIAQLVRKGKNNMSAYQDRLTPEEIETVSRYVLTQAENDWRS